jgi:hypothetical protein
VILDVTLHAADLILKLSTSVLKRVIDCECQVGMPLVCRRRPRNIDLSAVGEGESYMDIVQTTFVVSLTGSFHDDTACSYTTRAPLKFG